VEEHEDVPGQKRPDMAVDEIDDAGSEDPLKIVHSRTASPWGRTSRRRSDSSASAHDSNAALLCRAEVYRTSALFHMAGDVRLHTTDAR